MFCPTNEKLQNFTEKTKLLAQKCSQQIRVAAQQHLQNHYNSHQNQQQQQQQQQQKLNSEQEQGVCVEQQQQEQEKYKSNNKIDNGDKNNENKNIKSSCNSSVKYLCSCTGGTLRGFSKKNKDGQATVKWYVKPTWRLWGEEREKDAIFTVYLKKVRYHRPTPSANNDSDDEISHLEWETVRVRFVKGATLARLVEALATDDGELESTFINVFLSTYRTFSNLKEILDLLIKRYDQLNEMCLNEIELQHHNHHNHNENDSKFNNDDDIDCSKIKSITAATTTTVASGGTGSIYEQHKKTLVSALHVWLDGFPEDWNEDNLRYILNFTSKRLPHSELHIKVLQRLERFLRLPRLNDQQQQQQQQQFNTPYYHFNNHHNHYENNQLHWTNSSPSLLSSYPPSINISSSVADITELFSGMCLTPAFRGPPSHLLQAYRFPHVPVKHFAEQLTRMDMELFKRLIPHQCLGATWAKRDKNEADTVVATVNQFNAVSYRVISSILVEPRIKPQERALNIATWIDIAQELRLLKNFSSLKAIISGLQSNAVYRLSKTWLALPREKLEIFNELARIFSEDNNAWTQREVLMREGTAKFADTVGENDRHLQKVFQKQDTHTSHGTIPYLGTFLTDLTMIHAAIPDTIADGLINFDKKRKEFEILAQIKLLQGAANAYNLRSDHHFDRWFASMLVLDEREAHQISCQIEPQPELKTKSSSNNNSINSVLNSNNSNYNYSNNSGHKKSDSIASNSSSGAGSQFYYEINNLTTTTTTTLSNNTSRHSSRHNSLDRDTIPPTNSSSILSASSSISNLSIDSSNSGGQKSTLTTTTSTIQQQQQQQSPNIKCNGINNKNNGSISHINAQLVQSPQMKNAVPDFYIIRVTYETDNIETNGIVLYKSIMLGNNERTPQVIRNAMMKLGLDSDPDKWTLSQVLPDKELLMPPNANVYYAVNTAYNLNFILRHKKDDVNNTKGQ